MEQKCQGQVTLRCSFCAQIKRMVAETALLFIPIHSVSPLIVGILNDICSSFKDLAIEYTNCHSTYLIYKHFYPTLTNKLTNISQGQLCLAFKALSHQYHKKKLFNNTLWLENSNIANKNQEVMLMAQRFGSLPHTGELYWFPSSKTVALDSHTSSYLSHINA